jgi:hypothetical protein
MMKYFYKWSILLISAAFISLAGCGDSTGNDSGSHDHGSHSHGNSNTDFSDYTEKRATMTENGAFFVEYEPTVEPIAVNELFEIEVSVYETDKKESPVENPDVSVKARMPTHGHGMNTDPNVSKDSEGVFVIEGMKFHMPSNPKNPWTLEIEITKAGTTDVAKFMVVTNERS